MVVLRQKCGKHIGITQTGWVVPEDSARDCVCRAQPKTNTCHREVRPGALVSRAFGGHRVRVRLLAPYIPPLLSPVVRSTRLQRLRWPMAGAMQLVSAVFTQDIQNRRTHLSDRSGQIREILIIVIECNISMRIKQPFPPAVTGRGVLIFEKLEVHLLQVQHETVVILSP